MYLSESLPPGRGIPLRRERMSLFNLTRQERQIILFLIFVSLLGLGINFLTKHCSQIRVIGYVSQDIGKIDINQADKEALIGVPGIGAKLAQRIVDYRRQHGELEYITELKNIKGIGESKFQAIKDYFVVN